METHIRKYTPLLVSFLLGFSSCGKVENVREAILMPYLNRFIAYGATYGKTFKLEYLSMEFTHIANNKNGDTILGQCWNVPGFQSIEINVDSWAYMVELQKEELMFHELGHCLLNRSHRDALLPDHTYISIMNSYAINWHTYESNHSYYIWELFNVR